MIFPHTSFPPLPAIHMSKRKGKTFFRVGALHKIFSSSVYKLSTYHWPKHPAPTNGVIGWISENSWPQPCVTRCFLFTCFSSSTHPTNQCLPACAPTEASLERSCLPLVGRLLMFVATLPNLNNLIELNTLHRRSTAAARTNSASQCVLHNQYNHTPSTRYRSAGNLLCVSVELLQTSPWPGFALAALPSCWFKWHTAGHLKSDGHFVTLFRPPDHFAPFYCCFSLPATHCFLFVRLCSHMTWTW